MVTHPLSSVDTAWRSLQFALEAAALAEERAENAAGIAARHEALVKTRPSTADRHARTAELHRRNEACQRAAVKVHRAFADRLQEWIAQRMVADRPRLMSAVANAAGWQGAVLTLSDRGGAERLVAASDDLAREAHELEVGLAEGPSWDAALGAPGVVAAAQGDEITQRWPLYGPALTRLGVRAVAGAPLRVERRGEVRGTLTVIGAAVPPASATPLKDIADALSRSVLRAPGLVRSDAPGVPRLALFEDEDFQPALHQAAGMLHERHGWSIDDTVALIRAHAYAEERSVGEVAQEVVKGAALL